MLKKIAVVYHFFPHYRASVMRALAASCDYHFEFWGSTREINGIRPFVGDEFVRIHPLGCRQGRRDYRLSGYWPVLTDSRVRGLIILGNPNILDTWILAVAGRILGKKVLFWTHGWLRQEAPIKAAFRNFYFRLAHAVLTYDERAKRLAVESGFPAERISPIYNSLNWKKAQEICKRLDANSLSTEQENPKRYERRPRLICTARLNPECRFDLLLEALAILEGKGMSVDLVLVGDGPEREALELLSFKHGLRVEFMGAIYDEDRLGPMIYAADITVSPGKVGLTAIHSLMYGTPVISHDDMNAQMPEAEAITPGQTGLLFKHNDVVDLARQIESWLSCERDRGEVRSRCHEVIVNKYNPETQRALIEQCLDDLFEDSRR